MIIVILCVNVPFCRAIFGLQAFAIDFKSVFGDRADICTTVTSVGSMRHRAIHSRFQALWGSGAFPSFSTLFSTKDLAAQKNSSKND